MAKSVTSKNKEGRPLTPIDWDIVGDLCMKGCSGIDIAGTIGINEDTLYARCQTDNNLLFSEFSRSFRAKGDALLHKVQFDVATTDKDKAMLIWLGKQRLGQADKKEIENKNINREMTQEESEAALEKIKKRLFP